MNFSWSQSIERSFNFYSKLQSFNTERCFAHMFRTIAPKLRLHLVRWFRPTSQTNHSVFTRIWCATKYFSHSLSFFPSFFINGMRLNFKTFMKPVYAYQGQFKMVSFKSSIMNVQESKWDRFWSNLECFEMKRWITNTSIPMFRINMFSFGVSFQNVPDFRFHYKIMPIIQMRNVFFCIAYCYLTLSYAKSSFHFLQSCYYCRLRMNWELDEIKSILYCCYTHLMQKNKWHAQKQK